MMVLRFFDAHGHSNKIWLWQLSEKVSWAFSAAADFSKETEENE